MTAARPAEPTGSLPHGDRGREPPGTEVPQLRVRQDLFAGERFWAAANRLAARRGHDGHDRYLSGQVDPTDRYTLWCRPCGQPVATFHVQRDSGE